MKFKPQTEEELQRNRLRPKGSYPFTVSTSGEQASKSAKNPGRMMVALKLVVHGPDGDFTQNDYFADWFNAHKLRHFAETTGNLSAYEKGEINFADNRMQGAQGYLYLGEGKDKNEDIRNEVKDYIMEADYKESLVQSQPEVPAADDDVPF